MLGRVRFASRGYASEKQLSSHRVLRPSATAVTYRSLDYKRGRVPALPTSQKRYTAGPPPHSDARQNPRDGERTAMGLGASSADHKKDDGYVPPSDRARARGRRVGRSRRPSCGRHCSHPSPWLCALRPGGFASRRYEVAARRCSAFGWLEAQERVPSCNQGFDRSRRSRTAAAHDARKAAFH